MVHESVRLDPDSIDVETARFVCAHERRTGNESLIACVILSLMCIVSELIDAVNYFEPMYYFLTSA